MSKDIETLRNENSHHSGTISNLQVVTCNDKAVCVCVTVDAYHKLVTVFWCAASRQTDRHTDRHTDRLTDRQTDRQTDNQNICYENFTTTNYH